VLGPSFGESIIVGVPGHPRRWLVIDSLLTGRGETAVEPVRRALADLDAVPELILLTHAHADHAAGMDRLIEAMPDSTRVATAVEDFHAAASAKLRGAAQRVEAAAALRSIKQLPPERRWGTDLQPESLGDATVTILHPSVERTAELIGDPSAHPNLLSSPVRIDWRDKSVLLAADLERDEWAALATQNRLSDCDPTKVPHHGSPGAFDEVWAGAVPSAPEHRTLLITPFNRRPKLPDLDHPCGVPALVKRVQRIHLTALPFRPADLVRGEIKLAELRSVRDAAAAARRPLPKALGGTKPAQSDDQPHTAWVRVELDPTGTCSVTNGWASVTING
jgi:hypothetical protein